MFAVILRSGMPVARTVQMVGETLPDRSIQRWLKQVLRDVESGMPLADSMANRGASFLPTTFVETIRAGGASGNLDLSFGNLSKQFEKQYKMNAQIRSALLLFVGVAVMTVIMVYVVPMFTRIFEAAGAEMPFLTQVVINISAFFQHYWFMLPVAGIGGFLGYKFLDSFPRMHLLLERLRLQIPVIGKISLLGAVCQFAGTMTSLIASGLTILDATEITANVISGKVADIVPLLQRGSTLGDALRQQKDVTGLVFQQQTSGWTVMSAPTIGGQSAPEVTSTTAKLTFTFTPDGNGGVAFTSVTAAS